MAEDVGSGPEPPALAVGIDAQPVSEILFSLREFGDRYLQHLFTEGEIADCRSFVGEEPGADEAFAERLAGRFAAKEAFLKAASVSGSPPAWREIEILLRPGGAPYLRLRGRAAQLAETAGLGPLAVSITHSGGMAFAIMIAPHRIDTASDYAGAAGTIDTPMESNRWTQ